MAGPAPRPTEPGSESDAAGLRFAIVVARFNQDITEVLLAGAERTLIAHGAAAADVDVYWAPGAF